MSNVAFISTVLVSLANSCIIMPLYLDVHDTIDKVSYWITFLKIQCKKTII